ncbi:hypothetical protein [Shimazuella kribbensis]|uniref:hypothetical protein n=1 Tax=Shimazuella kribbensis TaxID=139808 RepID=UPI00041BE2D3|nr:hypothetical protein [Shimazuella kribbensis]
MEENHVEMRSMHQKEFAKNEENTIVFYFFALCVLRNCNVCDSLNVLEIDLAMVSKTPA